MVEGRKIQKQDFMNFGAHGEAYKIIKVRKLVDFLPAQLLPPRNIYEQT